ncbi:MAG: hypothetical protein HQK53_07780 [Oligoflexia bacterium]|nr:hypothetical protein [Oligoflexia bacterium]
MKKFCVFCEWLPAFFISWVLVLLQCLNSVSVDARCVQHYRRTIDIYGKIGPTKICRCTGDCLVVTCGALGCACAAAACAALVGALTCFAIDDDVDGDRFKSCFFEDTLACSAGIGIGAGVVATSALVTLMNCRRRSGDLCGCDRAKHMSHIRRVESMVESGQAERVLMLLEEVMSDINVGFGQPVLQAFFEDIMSTYPNEFKEIDRQIFSIENITNILKRAEENSVFCPPAFDSVYNVSPFSYHDIVAFVKRALINEKQHLRVLEHLRLKDKPLGNLSSNIVYRIDSFLPADGNKSQI